MELGEGLKKILLVGIGTAAVTAEKSKEILDELVKKGELTVEQGKVLNQELKHTGDCFFETEIWHIRNEGECECGFPCGEGPLYRKRSVRKKISPKCFT